MRELSELEKFNVDYLADQEIPFVAVMMTENILSHAIFDATRQIVTFLKQNAIHDYSQQKRQRKKKGGLYHAVGRKYGVKNDGLVSSGVRPSHGTGTLFVSPQYRCKESDTGFDIAS